MHAMYQMWDTYSVHSMYDVYRVYGVCDKLAKNSRADCITPQFLRV